LHANIVLSNTQKAPPHFPDYRVEDIDSLISHCYVMRSDHDMIPLHSHVSSHVGFQQFQAQFTDNPFFAACALTTVDNMPINGVLLWLSAHPSDTQEWKNSRSPALSLLCTLLLKAQREDQQRAQQKDLQYEVKRQGLRAFQQAQHNELDRHYVGESSECYKIKTDIVQAASNEQAVLIQGETLVEAADGGVLFLDEIGEMPIELQAVLLRVLNEKCFRRIGEVKENPVDFRLISATNATLVKKIESGHFRSDLFYRLCQMRITPPALREHINDIELLCHHFMSVYSHKFSRYPELLSKQNIQALQGYDWPGNVRELENFLYAYFDSVTGEYENVGTLEQQLHEWAEYRQFDNINTSLSLSDLLQSDNLRAALEQFERELIARRLFQYQGNRGLVASSLGLPKRTLAYKCQKLQIEHEGAAVL